MDGKPSLIVGLTAGDFSQALSSVNGAAGSRNELSDGGDDNGSSNNADSSGAAGGFLIYPNQPNTNQAASVYSK